MEAETQIAHLTKDLNALFDKYQDEFDLPYQSLVGVLEVQKAILMEELLSLSYEVDEKEADKD